MAVCPPVRKTTLLLLALIWTLVMLHAHVFGQSIALPFRPTAAEYSVALDRLILVSTSPSQLHIFGPSGPTDTVVSLAKPPMSLAVSPNGLFAAVGHDGAISYVNLSSATVEKTVTIPVLAQSITMSAAWIYVLPGYSGSPVSVNIATGGVTSSNFVYGSGGRFNPAVNAVYGTRDGLSPNDIEKYDVSTGPITGQTDSIYHGDYSVCGPVFFSPAGDRIYTGCATVFRASTDRTIDMHYVTALSTVSFSLRPRHPSPNPRQLQQRQICCSHIWPTEAAIRPSSFCSTIPPTNSRPTAFSGFTTRWDSS